MTKTTKTIIIQSVPQNVYQDAMAEAQKEADRIKTNTYCGMKTHPSYRNFTHPNMSSSYIKILSEIRRQPGQTRRNVCINARSNEYDSGLWSQMLNAGLIQYTKQGNLPYQYTITPSGEKLLSIAKKSSQNAQSSYRCML